MKIKIPRRYVLIRMLPMPDTLNYKSLSLILTKLVTDTNPAGFVITEGEVIVVPNKLHYLTLNQRKAMGSGFGGAMEWKTTIEIKPGDKAFINYHSVLVAFGKEANTVEKESDPIWFERDGETYCMIPYEEIYAYERDGKITPINGYNLCKGIKRENKSGLELPARYDYDENRYEVVTPGIPNQEYLNKDYSDCEVKPGDVVMIQKVSSQYQNVTGNYHAVPFRGHDGEFFIQSRWMMAVLNKKTCPA